ncbi:hypothetical protein [Streptomyces tendae]|uniref:hypothetical protein n=1 Tax=Streptomyces tendae TaxID=1932 RepID=UPI0037A741FD
MRGHYPGHPILPAAVVMDWTQQAVDTLNGSPLHLHRLHRARFIRPFHPGDTLHLALHIHPPQADEEADGRPTLLTHTRITHTDGRTAVELDATYTPAGTHA